MPYLSFDTTGGFPFSMPKKYMSLNSSNNNKVQVVEKTGYIFQGWYDYMRFTVYSSDKQPWIANEKQLFIYRSDGTVWTPANNKYFPNERVFDKEGKAVKSNNFWSLNYPNGVWLHEEDITLVPGWLDNKSKMFCLEIRGQLYECYVEKDRKRGYPK